MYDAIYITLYKYKLICGDRSGDPGERGGEGRDRREGLQRSMKKFLEEADIFTVLIVVRFHKCIHS